MKTNKLVVSVLLAGLMLAGCASSGSDTAGGTGRSGSTGTTGDGSSTGRPVGGETPAGALANVVYFDFDMSETIDKDEVTAALRKLVDENHPVYLQWITDEELAANPGIVKSKNVRPPVGLGRVSLVCIGENSAIDSQPCGGTHVSETQEVGAIHIAKIEKKGKENRRFRIRFGTADDRQTI